MPVDTDCECSGQGPTEAVLAAVASRDGVDETELRPPLYDVIDPNSLDRLFRDTDGLVSFEYRGYLVSVDADCDVELSELRSMSSTERT